MSRSRRPRPVNPIVYAVYVLVGSVAIFSLISNNALLLGITVMVFGAMSIYIGLHARKVLRQRERESKSNADGIS